MSSNTKSRSLTSTQATKPAFTLALIASLGSLLGAIGIQKEVIAIRAEYKHRLMSALLSRAVHWLSIGSFTLYCVSAMWMVIFLFSTRYQIRRKKIFR